MAHEHQRTQSQRYTPSRSVTKYTTKSDAKSSQSAHGVSHTRRRAVRASPHAAPLLANDRRCSATARRPLHPTASNDTRFTQCNMAHTVTRTMARRWTSVPRSLVQRTTATCSDARDGVAASPAQSSRSCPPNTHTRTHARTTTNTRRGTYNARGVPSSEIRGTFEHEMGAQSTRATVFREAAMQRWRVAKAPKRRARTIVTSTDTDTKHRPSQHHHQQHPSQCIETYRRKLLVLLPIRVVIVRIDNRTQCIRIARFERFVQWTQQVRCFAARSVLAAIIMQLNRIQRRHRDLHAHTRTQTEKEQSHKLREGSERGESSQQR